MPTAHRAAVVLVVFFVSLTLVGADDRSPSPRPSAEKKPLSSERILADRLQEARQAIHKESWKEAARLLQGLLDREEDVWLENAGVGLRREAQRLLATLPPEGRKAYRELAGPAAARLLAETRTSKDDTPLRLIVERYLHTESGPEALALLARHEADAGHDVLAAPAFALLLQYRASADWPIEDLYRAATAFRHSGDTTRADQLTQLLLDRLGRDPLRLGRRTLERDQLRQELARPLTDSSPEWSLHRGDPRRSGQAQGNVPFLAWKWHLPTLEGSTEVIEKWLHQAEAELHRQKRPILNASFPITAVGFDPRRGQNVPLIVCRGHGGIMAINALTGSLMWKQPTMWSLESLLGTDNPDGGPARNQAVTSWLQYYIQQKKRPEILFENSVLGTLSADSHFVYGVDDLVVPPPPDLFNMNVGFPGQGTTLGDEEMNKAVGRSRLYACSLARGGALEWRLGEEESELADCIFLGPPLPLDGKIYLLVEKQQEIRLVCMDPTAPDTRPGKKPGRMLARVLWTQTLDQPRKPIRQDVTRRLTAVPLAYAAGVLVCPTYAGSVLGVDPLQRRLLWKYTTKDTEQPAREKAPPGIWKTPTPVISDGKVVFTAPDSHDLHCLSLREGTRLWTVTSREDDLYLAGVKAGKVLVVGSKGMRALSLASGLQLWTLTAGMPSGQGAFVGDDYYLPLEEHADSRKPGIALVDLAAGHLLAFVPMRKLPNRDDEPEGVAAPPGNLLFTQGLLLAQNARNLVAYPLAAEQLKEIKKRLDRNALDPIGLMDRALVQLSEGDRLRAIDDLRKVLEQKPGEDVIGRANATLYEVLTDLVRHDFDRAEPYLKLYEDLCTQKPATRQQEKQLQQRRLRFHFLVGQGRERQGRPRDALRAYLGAQEGDIGTNLVTTAEEMHWPRAPVVLLRRHIRLLLEKATPAQRKELEEEIVRQGPARDAGKLAALLPPETTVGCAARLRLAHKRLAAQEHAEADVLLQQVRRHGSPAQAAQAVRGLAEMMLARGLPADAAHYYRLLRRDFADIRLPDGKTGAEVWKDVGTDRRLLPYLDEPAAPWPQGEVRARLEKQKPHRPIPMLLITPHGAVLPSLRQSDVGVALGSKPRLLFRSRATGEHLWEAPLDRMVVWNESVLSSDYGRPDVQVGSLGTLLFVPVGPHLVAVDAVGRRILWQKVLLNPLPDGSSPVDYQGDQALLPERWITYPESGWAQQTDLPPVVSPSVVCVLAEEGLLGLDPRTGEVLWERSDVARRASLFGDEGHVCLVERNAAGRPVSTRVFRTADGSSVAAKDFADLYRERLGVHGSRLLLGGREDGKVTLRLHDVPAGKDVWRHSYPAGTILLRSTTQDFTGSVSPRGVVSVLDVGTGKEVLHGEMEVEDLEKVQLITLLADASSFYLACNRPLRERPNWQGGAKSTLLNGTGLWSVPINGRLIAFDRAGKGSRWRSPVVEQRLVMNHFADNPYVLLASFSTQQVAGKRADITSIVAIEKRRGRILYDKSDVPVEGFHTLLVTPETGRIDFQTPSSRLILEREKVKGN